MGQRVSASLIEQFERMWGSLREATENFSDEKWRRSEIAYLVPASLAMHTIETTEFYIGDLPGDKFPWGRLGGDWDGRDPAKWPGQERMAEYLEEVREKTRAWLMRLEDEAWFGPAGWCEWTGKTMLDRALYMLRHAQHHLAQLNVELRRAGLKPAEWA